MFETRTLFTPATFAVFAFLTFFGNPALASAETMSEDDAREYMRVKMTHNWGLPVNATFEDGEREYVVHSIGLPVGAEFEEVGVKVIAWRQKEVSTYANHLRSSGKSDEEISQKLIDRYGIPTETNFSNLGAQIVIKAFKLKQTATAEDIGRAFVGEKLKILKRNMGVPEDSPAENFFRVWSALTLGLPAESSWEEIARVYKEQKEQFGEEQ